MSVYGSPSLEETRRGIERALEARRRAYGMMNPTYHVNRLREVLEEHKLSRERSLAVTKLDECEMWLARCEPTEEAVNRDQQAGA